MEWLFGLISGVLATIAGFALTIVWDLRKDRRQTQERDAVVTRAVDGDLKSNVTAIDRNILALTTELGVIAEKKFLVAPLSQLKVGFWEVAKINPTNAMLTQGTIASLSELVSKSEEINESIRSREHYRIHSEAMTNFHAKLQIYDQGLIHAMSALKAFIAKYETRAQQIAPADRAKPRSG